MDEQNEQNEQNERKTRRDWLVERFEAERSHLEAVAYRMLGSQTEAEDAVQEILARLSRADTSDVAESRRLADHSGRACLPRYAAFARHPTRGVAERGCARAGRGPR